MKKRIKFYLILIFIFFAIFAINKVWEISRYYYVYEDMQPQELAELSVRKYIGEGKIVRHKGNLIGVDERKAGVFVSIYAENQLRGCIGTMMPRYNDIKDEIVRNAIAAATFDTRFKRVSKEELDKLAYSVDILSKLEKVDSVNELNPEKYGIIITSASWKRAVLLPDLPGINTTDVQIAIARQKAGIRQDEKIKIQKFTVKRYSGKK
jgi:AmmeMemoRadiSam system protein A